MSRRVAIRPSGREGLVSLGAHKVASLKSVIPAPLKRMLKPWLMVPRRQLVRARLGFGVQPLSGAWGERGPTLHRSYLEQFLDQERASIRGRCLEFQNDTYATRYGGPQLVTLDILHRDFGRPEATIVADLTEDNAIASDQFDCVICTYVLHVVSNPDRVVSELHRMLKPGGTLLACVPDITVQYPEFDELWRFTAKGLGTLLRRHFHGEVSVQGFGNSLTAAGEIRGLVRDDFSHAERDYHDPRYSVIVCARAVKR